jgi:cell fate (sporulation/competence/biofilm development) regulator YlbF (YheA/YmcA/DUF963 family)
MTSSISRYAKSIALVTGFLFGTLGAAWSFVFDDRQNEELRRLSDAKADLVMQMDSLNSIASDYFIANQQGDLIFLLAQQENARQDLAMLIYEGNTLDRATPVRNMIGALALANQLNYQQTYGAYEKLNEETRANLSFENFIELKQVEQSIILQGQERVPLLLDSIFELDQAINANRATQQRNRVIGLISSVFGNLLLLSANLVAESGRGKNAKG